MGGNYTAAQNRATQKYIKSHLDSIQIRTPKGDKERWKAAADKRGTSLNRYIIDAVEAAMRRDAENE